MLVRGQVLNYKIFINVGDVGDVGVGGKYDISRPDPMVFAWFLFLTPWFSWVSTYFY